MAKNSKGLEKWGVGQDWGVPGYVESNCEGKKGSNREDPWKNQHRWGHMRVQTKGEVGDRARQSREEKNLLKKQAIVGEET